MIPPVSSPIPAAQYYRKCSDDERYSIDNQKAAIKEYANSRGFAIVLFRSSEKSGVAADWRKAGNPEALVS